MWRIVMGIVKLVLPHNIIIKGGKFQTYSDLIDDIRQQMEAYNNIVDRCERFSAVMISAGQ